jgi:predicted nucleic acid-binding protein
VSVFVDTAAFYALLDRDDDNHGRARKEWERLLEGDGELITTNYVVVECLALVQHRLGIKALRALADDVLPLAEVHWIEKELHAAAAAALLAAGRKRLSLVDCTSFEAMRRRRIRTAFTFDRHFQEQGFDRIP